MTIDLTLSPKDKILKMLENMSIKSDFAWIDDFLSDNYTFNGKPSSKRDNKAWLVGLHRRYPGMMFSPLEILGEGEKVGVRWKLAVPAYTSHIPNQPTTTYGPGQFRGTNIMRFEGGKLAANNQDDTSGKHHFFEDASPDVPIDHFPAP